MGGRIVLIFDFRSIGNKLLDRRHICGMTQSDVAEAAGLSDRTYADIERGGVNMRIETLLKICTALDITPDDILTDRSELNEKQRGIFERIESCAPKERETAMNLLTVYLDSLERER